VKRKPGRPTKNVGLSTPAELKKVVDGNALRNMQQANAGQEGSVLPSPREGDAPPAGEVRLFGTADPDNRVGNTEVVKSSVPDATGRNDSSGELTFTALLRKIAVEQAAEEWQDSSSPMTNMEVLARKVFNTALREGMQTQRARELVIERLEGKAGRAAPVQGSNTELDDQLDRAAVALLNDLAPTPKEDPNA
jgi:hypothetical protein